MPERLSNQESHYWDAMYGDVKFLVLEYKLRDEWTELEKANQAIIQLFQYCGSAQQEYFRFIRHCRMMEYLGRILGRSDIPDDVRKVVRRTHKKVFNRAYQPYIAKFWNWEFINKRQGAKRSGNSPYKRWSWLATQTALKELASKRPNTFRYVLAYYEAQLEEMSPLKPPSLTRVLRYMRDIAFDMETKSAVEK
jgi:hypothetical protein